MTGDPGRVAPAGITVLGLGNVLLGDDSFGPHVIATLQARYEFPGGVELVDAGTPGHELSVYLDGRDALIVVDAVRAQGQAGEIRLFRGEDVVARPPSIVTSPHEPGLRDALLKLSFGGRAPADLLLVGVIPLQFELGAGLSEPVERAVPEAESAVLAALAARGVSVREKSLPAPPALWWKSRHSFP